MLFFDPTAPVGFKKEEGGEGVSWEFAASLTTQKYPSFCAQKEKKRRSYSSAQMPATPASLKGVEFAKC